MNSPLILAPSYPLLWGEAEMMGEEGQGTVLWCSWDGQFGSTTAADNSLLFFPKAQKPSLNHLNNALPEPPGSSWPAGEFKGIMLWPGEQGGVHQELWGAQRAVLNHSLGTALPHKPNSSTPASAQRNSSTFPHRRMQEKQSLCHHHGDAAPTDPQGRKARHNKPPALLFPATASLLSTHYSFQWHFHC